MGPRVSEEFSREEVEDVWILNGPYQSYTPDGQDPSYRKKAPVVGGGGGAVPGAGVGGVRCESTRLPGRLGNASGEREEGEEIRARLPVGEVLTVN